jgi:non-specific serine/threonine protein kinase
VLSIEEFDANWAKGRALRPKRAIAEALALVDSVPGAKGGSVGRHSCQQKALTRREREIVALVARGLTNRAIAAELGIAERTADTHLSNILAKLGLRSRADVATWLAHPEANRAVDTRSSRHT